MDAHVNVLVADEDEALVKYVADVVRAMGHATTAVTDPAQALEHARSGVFEVVVTSFDMADDVGRKIERAALAARPEAQVVLLAKEGTAQQVAEAMFQGAAMFLKAPVHESELAHAVDRAAEYIALHRDWEDLHAQVAGRYEMDNLIGNSPPMQRVFERIEQAALTDATVLVQGETGTGKELVARAIHYKSRRRNNRFVPLNCAGLVETILESELFGHEKGAFTSATSSRIGLIEYAHRGTLFLDEIGDMPRSSQVKLLRVLEQGEIVRVGSNEPIHVDVRLIAATHRNLVELVKENVFRNDLYYRLNVVIINLPTLRERRSDIPLLAAHFLKALVDTHQKAVNAIADKVRQRLVRYDWPGNVRELRNCIEHMIVVDRDGELGEDDLPEYLPGEAALPLAQEQDDSLVGQPLDEVEKRHIARTLELTEGNRERAAQMLGIGERTLYRKIQKYNLR